MYPIDWRRSTDPYRLCADAPKPEPAGHIWHTPELLPQPALAGGFPASSRTSDLLPSQPESAKSPAPATVPAPISRIGGNWIRLGWFDLGMIVLLTWAVVRFWAYIMVRM